MKLPEQRTLSNRTQVLDIFSLFQFNCQGDINAPVSVKDVNPQGAFVIRRIEPGAGRTYFSGRYANLARSLAPGDFTRELRAGGIREKAWGRAGHHFQGPEDNCAAGKVRGFHCFYMISYTFYFYHISLLDKYIEDT